MARPSVSVVMPVYNGSEWVTEALRSVLEQSDPADEVIVVDDGSTDDSAEVVSAIDGVTLIRQENRGAPQAYDRGVRASRSEYVAFCPADDLWEPQKLEWQREVLRTHPQVDVACGHLRFFGTQSGDYRRPPGEGTLDVQTLFRVMYQGNVIAMPTTVVRRSLYEQLGGFRFDISIEDYEFWLRALTRNAQFFYDPRPLARWRAHTRNLSTPSLANLLLDYQIRREYRTAVDPDLAQRVLARDLRAVARGFLEVGEATQAHAAYKRAARLQPGARVGLGALALGTRTGRWVAVRRARKHRQWT